MESHIKSEQCSHNISSNLLHITKVHIFISYFQLCFKMFNNYQGSDKFFDKQDFVILKLAALPIF
jgi:hypothetical protein